MNLLANTGFIAKKSLAKLCLIALGASLAAALAVLAVPAQPTHATPAAGYLGEYYNNPTGPGGESPSFPGGLPVLTRTDSEINFNWGYGSPGAGVQNEDFIVRWTKTTYLAAGTYDFTISGDDGVRVYLDGNMIIDGWVDQGASTHYNSLQEVTAGDHAIKVEFYENGSVAEVYFNYTNQTDTDSDGIDNAIEDAGPNSGDANNDGTLDSEQANVASFSNAVSGKYAALEVGAGCTIVSANVAAESANTAVDVGMDYPSGLMRYTLSCDTPGATVQVNQYYFGQDPSGLLARKYSANNHSYQPLSGSALSQETIGGINAAKLAYQITDGGELDEDATTDATIIDPSGLGAVVVGVPNTGLGR